ncbi:MAG: hypothetical protein H0W84_02235 [Bacteroidetes bacterium]|nr:hypothetical protein [Bacteroidota bacterium]
MVGDKVNLTEIIKCFKNENGDYIVEGEMVKLKVIRKDKETILSFPAKFENGTIKNVLEIYKDKTVEQEKFFKLWTTGNR